MPDEQVIFKTNVVSAPGRRPFPRWIVALAIGAPIAVACRWDTRFDEYLGYPCDLDGGPICLGATVCAYGICRLPCDSAGTCPADYRCRNDTLCAPDDSCDPAAPACKPTQSCVDAHCVQPCSPSLPCSPGAVCRGDGFCVIPPPNWLGGYRYQLPIAVAYSSPASDYPVRIVLDTAALIDAGHLRSDCGDVRFAPADAGTELPYWLETGCGTGATVFRVQVLGPVISDAHLNAFYGDPSVTSASNLSAAFLFVDDFSTDPTQGRWSNILRQSSDATNEFFWTGSSLVLTTDAGSGGGGTFALADAGWDDGWAVSFRFRAGVGTGADGLAFGFFHQGNAGGGSTMGISRDGYAVELDSFGNAGDPSPQHFAIVDRRAGVVTHLASFDTPAVEDWAWHTVEVRSTGTTVQAQLDSWCCLTAPGITNRSYSRFLFGAATGGTDNNHEIDDVSLRRYAFPEPLATPGTEVPLLP